MPRQVQALTASQLTQAIKQAVRQHHHRRVVIPVGGCVGGSLQINFNEDGSVLSQLWAVRYTLNGKQRATTLGAYNTLTLAEFRDKVNEFQKQVKQGVDIVVARKAERKQTVHTFREVAKQFFKVRISQIAERTVRQMQNRFNLHYSKCGFIDTPVEQITPDMVVNFLQEFNSQSATREKLKDIGSGIFKLALIKRYANSNPFQNVGLLLPRRYKVQHYACLTEPATVGCLIKDINAYAEIHPVVAGLALFSIYTLARQQEARLATWSQIDWERRLWTVPAQLMKTRQEHVVPLSDGALQVLQQMQEYRSADNSFIFNSPLHKPFSENAVRVMLRAMGYTAKQATPHGFRAMGSTILHEQGYPHDLIELSLAHSIGNAVSQAYNHSQRLDARRAMLQAYYDYLTSLTRSN